MALTCQLSASYRNYSAGQTPPPMLTLQVYNPNAVAVAVTGIALQFYNAEGSPVPAPVNLPMPAMGPGQTVVAPALTSIYFGPFAIVVGHAGNANQSQSAPQQIPNALPIPRQLAHPTPQQYIIGAQVTGSDSSVNEAGREFVLVTYSARPPLFSQGGIADFAGPANSNLVGVL